AVELPPKFAFQVARSEALRGLGDWPRCQARKSAPSTTPLLSKSPGCGAPETNLIVAKRNACSSPMRNFIERPSWAASVAKLPIAPRLTDCPAVSVVGATGFVSVSDAAELAGDLTQLPPIPVQLP